MVAAKNKSAELYSYLEREESGTEERGEDKKNSSNVRGSKEGGRDGGREGKKKRKEGGEGERKKGGGIQTRYSIHCTDSRC